MGSIALFSILVDDTIPYPSFALLQPYMLSFTTQLLCNFNVTSATSQTVAVNPDVPDHS